MKICSFLFLHFYLFLLKTQTALLTNTPVLHVSPWWAFCSRCTSLRVLMGMPSRYMSLSTPLPPPTQLGAWRVPCGCYSEDMSRWRMLHVGPSLYSTEISRQTWFRTGLNHIRAGGLRRSPWKVFNLCWWKQGAGRGPAKWTEHSSVQ